MNGKNGSEIVKLLGGKEVSISVEMDDETRNFFELILNMQKKSKGDAMSDNVNHPAHYAPKFRTKPIECIDITRHLPFSLGNAFKYVWRAGDKGGREKGLEDLDKAVFYLEDSYIFAGVEQSEAILIFKMLEEEYTSRFYALESIIKGNFSAAKYHIDALRKELENAD